MASEKKRNNKTPVREPRRWTAELVVSVALCTPPARMVAVRCYHGQDEPACFLDPVVAIESPVVNNYHAWDVKPPPRAGTHAEMIDNGWEFDTQSRWPSYLCASSQNPQRLSRNLRGLYSVVVCPWPPEEDRSRLAPVIEALCRELAALRSNEDRERAERKAMAEATP